MQVLERPFGDYCKVLPHPYDSEEFKARVSNFLTSPMDIKTKLWECTMSTGDIGSSGAIITDKPRENSYNESETIFLFRNHHVLCDGVSLSTVVSDASDEREELNDALQSALDKQTSLMKRAGLISRLLTWLMYYIVGSIYALSVQFWNMITSSNPFDIFAIGSRMQERKRSVAWRYLASVQEAKSTLKANSRLPKHATLNDLFVSILSRALEKQYQVLQNSSSPKQTQPTVNIVCPVHLSGGVGPPGRCIGNSIGAFVTTVPFRPNNPFSSTSRLCRVSQNLNKVKHTPAAKISWAVSSFISTFAPESVAKFALVYANCHAVAAISNVHGFPKKIHWMGRPVEILCAFLPLPSGIPIGIVVTSYNGKIIISLDADEGIVPDADKFLDFMIEEYQALKTESDLPSPE